MKFKKQIPDLIKLENLIGYSFNDKDILTQSLTHPSSENSKFSNMSVNSLGNLTHPKKVERNYLADSLTFEYLKLLNIFTETKTKKEKINIS